MEKVALSKGFWNPKKTGVVMHVSEIINLESQIKMLVSAFF